MDWLDSAPVLAGATLAVLGVTGWLALESLAERWGAGSPRSRFDGVIVAVLSLQAGYFLAVQPLVRRVGRGCLEDLRPFLQSSEEEFAKLAGAFWDRTRPEWKIAVVAGAVATLVFQEAQFGRFSRLLTAPAPALGELWAALVAWAAWSLGLAGAGAFVGGAGFFRRLGREAVSVDLLRTDQLAPFSRFGLRLASAVVGVMTLWAASLVAVFTVVDTQVSSMSWATGAAVAMLYVGLALVAFVIPQLGIRARIRKEKESVSNRLAALLPTFHQTVDEAGRSPERLAALLSVRARVHSTPEWPSGEHTRVRLAIYLLVPLLSWSAAALVEELISRLVG